jgi:hypothetical protein
LLNNNSCGKNNDSEEKVKESEKKKRSRKKSLGAGGYKLNLEKVL